MRGALGIDTSNYTTSAAFYRPAGVLQQKRLLPVAAGQLGLRQSDAVFSHVKALGDLVEQLMAEVGEPPAAVGVSATPRDEPGSYMPCFLTGVMAARTTAAALGAQLVTVSHQAGHLAAALLGAERLELLERPFVAFHVSGGTTECLLCENLLARRIRLLSATGDLNAGQLVDRVGKMLGLDFPAGPALEALALTSTAQEMPPCPAFREGNPCLSGLENQCRDRLTRGAAPADVARFCLLSIAAALRCMAVTAREQTGCPTLLFAGGVMSNTLIRAELTAAVGGLFAPPEYSRDNAVGVALLAAVETGLTFIPKGETPTCP